MKKETTKITARQLFDELSPIPGFSKAYLEEMMRNQLKEGKSFFLQTRDFRYEIGEKSLKEYFSPVPQVPAPESIASDPPPPGPDPEVESPPRPPRMKDNKKLAPKK